MPRKESGISAQGILDALRAAVEIIKVIEQLKRGDPGIEKLAGAVEILQTQEPPVAETPELIAAREAMLSAQVAYANALSGAAK